MSWGMADTCVVCHACGENMVCVPHALSLNRTNVRICNRKKRNIERNNLVVYLLEPDGIIKKSYPDMESLPDKEDFLIGKSYDDLVESFDWRESDCFGVSEWPALIELALRYGEVCARGLILDSRWILPVFRLKEMREAAEEANRPERRRSMRLADEFVDQVFPGWTDERRKTDAAAAAENNYCMKEVQSEIESLLKASIKPDLVSHWERIGGRH